VNREDAERFRSLCRKQLTASFQQKFLGQDKRVFCLVAVLTNHKESVHRTRHNLWVSKTLLANLVIAGQAGRKISQGYTLGFTVGALRVWRSVKGQGGLHQRVRRTTLNKAGSYTVAFDVLSTVISSLTHFVVTGLQDVTIFGGIECPARNGAQNLEVPYDMVQLLEK